MSKCSYCPTGIHSATCPNKPTNNPIQGNDLDRIITTLFHSYDARGNQLAIDKAKTAITNLLITELWKLLDKKQYWRGPSVTTRAGAYVVPVPAIEAAIKALEEKI